MTRILVVGGGGREHAVAWALTRSPSVDSVLVAPGNAGTELDERTHNVPVAAGDTTGLVELARSQSVDLVVVGPEAPLVAGLVDRLQAAGIAAFGPLADAARLEGSKAYGKDFLERHRIPTARAGVFSDVDAALAALDTMAVAPVVKATGLAAGKGVVVAESHSEAARAIREMLVDRRFGSAGEKVLLEERLVGTEMSVIAFCDGESFRLMPVAQDHKRLLVDDTGPNTGGMGAFVPSPVAQPDLVDAIAREVIGPTLAGVRSEGSSYRGALYAGIMLTADGIKVLEFNCRLGDPETQAVLPLLRSDLAVAMRACAEGDLGQVPVEWSDEASVTIVMASKGYPETPTDPAVIHGLGSVADAGVTVFHAGTDLVDGEVVATGGRVLAVTAVASELSQAAELAHAGVARIDFAGSQHRIDIARTTAEAPR